MTARCARAEADARRVALAAEHGIRFVRDPRTAERVAESSVAKAVAVAYVAASKAAGRECSWGPDNDDPTQAWIYETEVTS